MRALPVLLLSLLAAGCVPRPPLEEPLAHAPATGSAGFRRSAGALLGGGFVPGNKIRTLENGDEIFSAMLAAIRSARRTITFETFVFESGDIPNAFAAALAERARAGVRVHVILDAVGAAKSRPSLPVLRDAGVDLVLYHSPWWFDVRRNNHRTHRKLLVVDGRLGFIGGAGIADFWKGNARNPSEWRDLHYAVEGPVVTQLQAAFEDNWLNSRRDLLLGPGYFPPLPPAGSAVAGAFTSSPLRGRATLEIMFHLAAASARRSLLIENAYFLPDDTLVDALCAAARRGVRVEILMPGRHLDQKAVRRHSRKTWPRLLAAGVRLYEYEPTMIHSKLLVADGLFVSVGSGNLDPRALRINDEANLDVLDPAFAAEQTRIFEADRRRSRPVDLGQQSRAAAAEAPRQLAEAPVSNQL